jgi:hypothetical protein
MLYMKYDINILSSDAMKMCEAWICNWIYWTFALVTTNTCDSLIALQYSPKNHCNNCTLCFSSKNYCNNCTHGVLQVFSNRCLEAASNGGLSPFSRFQNSLNTSGGFPHLHRDQELQIIKKELSIWRTQNKERKHGSKVRTQKLHTRY